MLVMLLIHHPIHCDGSIFYFTIRPGDFDIAMKQSRYDILKLESALALKFVCYPKCLCIVQVIIQRHGSVVTSTNLGPVFPCLYKLYRDGVEMIQMMDDGPAAGRWQLQRTSRIAK